MQLITIEDVPANVPPENRVAWMKKVNSLLARAERGNRAWCELEQWGFVGDYLPSDVEQRV